MTTIPSTSNPAAARSGAALPPNQPMKPKLIPAGCPTCKGSGYFGPDRVITNNPFCPDCKGRGIVEAPENEVSTCPVCDGHGHARDGAHIVNKPCIPCANTGKIIVKVKK
jgi:DnaJ-class molecular chaperone